MNELDKEGEPLPIKSSVIEALKKEELSIRVYVETSLFLKKKKVFAEETVKSKIQQIIDEWEKGEK